VEEIAALCRRTKPVFAPITPFGLGWVGGSQNKKLKVTSSGSFAGNLKHTKQIS
jgi:hypothetical protein